MSYNLPDGVTDDDIDRVMGDDPTDEQHAMLIATGQLEA